MMFRERKYTYIIPVIFIVVFTAVLPINGCKSSAVNTAASTETLSSGTTAVPESAAVSESADISSETAETTQPALIAEKITIIGAEMTGAIPSFMCINKMNLVTVEVKNTSDFTWRTEIPNLVRFGYHFYGQDVSFTEYDNTIRTVLPHDVKPGETATVNVEIKDILNKGTYVVQIDMVQEANDDPGNNFWFSSKGVTMIEGLSYFGNCQ